MNAAAETADAPADGARQFCAAGFGLLSCHACGLVSRAGGAHGAAACPRCGERLHRRKPNSVARAWAFLIAAAILYLPANLLPVMHTRSLFGAQSDTIMSGVVFLWVSGSWPLAVLVFFASVTVPLLKLIALALLLLSVQRRSRWRPLERARVYRLVEFIGRWSMLDIYVITILVALVHMQGLMEIAAGAGAVAFGAVVVLTILAAEAFDPRLIWDPLEENDGRNAA